MKIFLYTIAVILSIILIGYIFILNFTNNLDFEIKLKTIDLGLFWNTFRDSKRGTTVRTTLKVNISNKNSISIPISDLNISLYHNGLLIGKSANVKTNKNTVIIEPNTTSSFDYIIDFIVNNDILVAFTNSVIGNKVEIEYRSKMNIYNYPVIMKDKIIYP